MESFTIEYYKSKGYFNNKNIIVSGATGGVGSVLVKILLELGANVFAIVKSKDKFKSMFSNFETEQRLQYEVIDFTEKTNFSEIFSNIMLKLQGKLDSMILCHGKYYLGEIDETNPKDIDYAININFRSSFGLLSLATPFLKLSKGNVVAVSSLESYILKKSGLINAVTKSLVNSLVENSALELASFGVRINGVAPGIIQGDHRVGCTDSFLTDKNEKYLEKIGEVNLLGNKIIEPLDVVNTILFLACEESSFITGEIIKVDSGYSLNHDFSFKGS